MVAALLGAFASVGATTAPAAAEDASSDPVVFDVGMLSEVDSFSPFVGIEATSYEMWALMYDYMIGYSMEDMSPTPGLAESWETSDDGLTWTFDIRDGVEWSDGKPLTAADIAFTYNRILDGGPESATWSSYLKSVDKITSPDANTVVLALKKPNAVLPLLPIPILPEHVWSKINEDKVKSYPNEPVDGQAPVGSGPFTLVQGTVGGSLIRFEANPNYWQGAPNIDEVDYRVYQEEDPLVQALKTGEIDFAADLSPLSVQALEGEQDIVAQMGLSPGFDEIAFNVGAVDTKTGEPIGDGNPALQDRAFRQAISYAVDREVIAQKAYQGGAVPGQTIIPSAYSQWHWEPPADEAYTFDLDRAAQLLDEAGYTVGSDGKRTMPDGSQMDTLRLFARSGSTTSVQTLQFFQEWLTDLDVDAKVSTMSSGKLTGVIIDGNFDVFQWGWYVEPDPSSMLAFLTCDQLGSWNDAWWCNQKYSQLYDDQVTEMDEDTRVDMVKRMQEILYDDAAYIVTAYGQVGEAYRSDRFACLVPQPTDGGVLLFQYGVHNYLSMRPANDAGDCGGELDAEQAAAVAGGAEAAGGGSDGDGVGIVPVVVGGVIALAVVGAVGGYAGYRRAHAGQRE